MLAMEDLRCTTDVIAKFGSKHAGGKPTSAAPRAPSWSRAPCAPEWVREGHWVAPSNRDVPKFGLLMWDGGQKVARLDDADQEKWHYPPHTKAKHQLLKYYLGGWFPILTLGGNQRVLFLDGFAGRGRYNNGESGSPIIALETLLDHKSWPAMSRRKFIFVFIEADPVKLRPPS